jgi:hypothetical protein
MQTKRQIEAERYESSSTLKLKMFKISKSLCTWLHLKTPRPLALFWTPQGHWLGYPCSLTSALRARTAVQTLSVAHLPWIPC